MVPLNPDIRHVVIQCLTSACLRFRQLNPYMDADSKTSLVKVNGGEKQSVGRLGFAVFSLKTTEDSLEISIL